jgi:hypothetical protein
MTDDEKKVLFEELFDLEKTYLNYSAALTLSKLGAKQISGRNDVELNYGTEITLEFLISKLQSLIKSMNATRELLELESLNEDYRVTTPLIAKKYL